MRIRFAFDPLWPFCSLLMAVGAAFSLYCFIVCQAAADPAAWQHHGIYQCQQPTRHSPFRRFAVSPYRSQGLPIKL